MPPSHKGAYPGDVCSALPPPSRVSWTHQDPAVGTVTTAENNFKIKETYTTGVPVVVHTTVKMVLKFVSFKKDRKYTLLKIWMYYFKTFIS